MLRRARPLLGTVVAIHVREASGVPVPSSDPGMLEHAIEEAFAVIAHIGRVMSAHDPASDLGRLSTAQAGQCLTLDAHTVVVLQAARYWHRRSGGAFDPVKAARVLAAQGARPGVRSATPPGAMGLHALAVLSPTMVRVTQPLALDFGGIAKGYAVDQAIQSLQRAGVSSALVNAGGDLRAIGETPWPVEVRHAGHGVMDGRLRRRQQLTSGALATSVSGPLNPEFVGTAAAALRRWQSATVQARDCLTADVLTKWAMQSSLLCPGLRAALRLHQANMWRS